MTFLCTVRQSFDLLRSKNKVKLPTQSAEIRICDEKAPDDPTFLQYSSAGAITMLG